MERHDKYIALMHDFLDDSILDEEEQQELRDHLQKCTACHNHFLELEKSIALIKSIAHVTAPDNFTEKVMGKLPNGKRKAGIQRWFRNHPFLTAASLFIVLMTGSLISTWTGENEFSVSKQPNLVIENNTVIVPEGEVVTGDVVVRNGNLRIEGQVEGNVTVINGEKYLASAGEVTGEIEEINAIFDWLWYKIKSIGKEIISISEDKDK